MRKILNTKLKKMLGNLLMLPFIVVIALGSLLLLIGVILLYVGPDTTGMQPILWFATILVSSLAFFLIGLRMSYRNLYDNLFSDANNE